MKLFPVLMASLALVVGLGGPIHADFDYPDFAVLDGLALVNDAVQDGNEIVLTANALSEKGALWTQDVQPIGEGFSTTFQIEHVATTGGADGSAFVIQNAGPDALGDHASGLGYGGFLSSPDNGIAASVAIEFDDFQNNNFADPSGNHISVQTRGLDPNSSHHDYSLGVTTGLAPIAGLHTVRVEYFPGTPGILNVYFDDLTTPVLTVDIDLEAQVGGSTAHLGFTASTGGIAEEHRVLSWSFESFGTGPEFRRGDANGDGTYSGLVDGVFILNFQFIPGSTPPPCMDAADVDDDGAFSGLVDGLLALNFQFVPGTPPPPPPGVSDCGTDPTDDPLDCNNYLGCP